MLIACIKVLYKYNVGPAVLPHKLFNADSEGMELNSDCLTEAMLRNEDRAPMEPALGCAEYEEHNSQLDILLLQSLIRGRAVQNMV